MADGQELDRMKGLADGAQSTGEIIDLLEAKVAWYRDRQEHGWTVLHEVTDDYIRLQPPAPGAALPDGNSGDFPVTASADSNPGAVR